jgi:hypothetical protein
MALDLSKIGRLRLVRSLSQTVFIGSSPNFVKMFVVIISRPSSKTSLFAIGTTDLWPFDLSKNWSRKPVKNVVRSLSQFSLDHHQTSSKC